MGVGDGYGVGVGDGEAGGGGRVGGQQWTAADYDGDVGHFFAGEVGAVRRVLVVLLLLIGSSEEVEQCCSTASFAEIHKRSLN